ncbi:toprim domain-containing protein [Flagellimonas sp. 389]|uniref:CHC2 zinc finger domain-containing protein n=1 Tax=Flagellimonas sp. 389 TaxID=2835862 RepID=UPI001BD3009B|nr:CHC2 zinc finger domain-containing protein [Flagellimonas sp. 389]MBS9463278.1 toprim domain-containing protein [Flagellimonas sp. 389]
MTIAEIKEKLTILQVLDHYGIKVNKNKMVNCPFHDDKNPSMQVYPETNTVHCFSGNCEQTGKAIDQIDFIMHHEKCTKHEAITKAKKLIGVEIIEKVNQKYETKANLSETFIKLQEGLKRSKSAQNYLQERNLPTAAIGFNTKNTFNKMVQCVIFPLKDTKGKIVSFYGRHITRDAHYYLTNRTGLYPKHPSPEVKQLVLTESVIDAATVKQYTNYEVLALYGTNGLTPEHIEAIQSCAALEEIIFFLDGDEAGNTAVAKYTRKLSKLLPNLTISKVETPQGEDPNSLTISHEPEILNHLISERKVLSSSNEVESLDTQSIPTPEKPQFSPKEVAKQQHTNTTKGKLDTSNSEYLVFEKQPLLISVLGGIGLHPIDKMRVTLKIERTDSNSPLHQIRHSLDLYYDDQVEKLNRKAAERLELGSREVQLTTAELIQSLEDYRNHLLEQNKPKKPAARIIPPEREKVAISLMKRKGYLTKELPELLEKTGVVGERKNSIILWNTYATRKQHDPLHVICLGASGTGKTFLQERITDLVPEEDKVSGTAISENALYYAQDLNLRNKLFIIEDLDGASNILYALRELQTKKSISKMVTQKDSKGNMKTEIVTVHGPICLTATTTKERLYEDNANRCLLIYLDGSKQQQEAIMDDQRKRSAGKLNKKERSTTRELLRDMQALYEPITIRNPYAEQLKIPETVFKPLRTNSHYLAFIEGITFCMQFQRKKHQDPETNEWYINTEIEDIELANELMKEVLLSKSDELTKACRGFYEGLKADLQREQKTSFYRNEVREWKRINPNNLRYYLKQLVQYGYLNIIGRHKHNGHEYEISKLSEYQDLNGTLSSVLDKALEDIKRLREPDS